jgi:cytochrome c oxidase assembly factor CtaG
MRRLLLLALAITLPSPAWAHDGGHAGWTLDPWVTVPLALSAFLYAIGFVRLWTRSDHGRQSLRRSAMLFGSGWTMLAGAVVTPLHEAGEQSFTMHMIEHELIMLPAALLLVAARPGAAMLWAFPASIRSGFGNIATTGKGIWRALTDPVAATLIQAAVMWGWHAPALFDRALDSQGWHVAQHLSFLVSALLFWWAMAHGRAGRTGYGTAAACLFVTSLVGGALGALMTFSSSPWYAGYAAMGMTPAGLSPVEDQQLAGLLMWIPGGLFHAVAALWFLYKWLRASEVGHAFAPQ